MAACTSGIDAVDRLLHILDELAEVIEEVREQLKKETQNRDRPDC